MSRVQMMRLLSKSENRMEDEGQDIQHVWKTYLRGCEKLLPGNVSSDLQDKDHQSIPSCSIPSLLFTPADLEDFTPPNDALGSSSDPWIIPESGLSNTQAANSNLDSETESIVSDYSEMSDPVKEHLANIQIFRCSNLDEPSLSSFQVHQKVFRGVGENEENFMRRLQKTNFLSLAQEFAELKKRNSDVLPFNLHEACYREHEACESDASIIKTEEIEKTSTESFGRCKNSDKCWQNCPKTNSPTATNGNITNGNLKSDTLERKGLDGEDQKWHNFLEGLENGLSESVTDIIPPPLHRSSSSAQCWIFDSGELAEKICTNCSSEICAVAQNKKSKSLEDFDNCLCESIFPVDEWKHAEEQVHWALETEDQLEASRYGNRDEICQKLAMSHNDRWPGVEMLEGKTNEVWRDEMCLEICYVNEAADDLELGCWSSDCSRLDIVPNGCNVEKTDSRLIESLPEQAILEDSSKITLVLAKNGISGSTDQSMNWQMMRDLSLAQLQVLANQLHEQIEVLNQELVLTLLERDNLNMVQDSMLVDIEDLTGRARDYAAKIDSKTRIQQSV